MLQSHGDALHKGCAQDGEGGSVVLLTKGRSSHKTFISKFYDTRFYIPFYPNFSISHGQRILKFKISNSTVYIWFILLLKSFELFYLDFKNSRAWELFNSCYSKKCIFRWGLSPWYISIGKYASTDRVNRFQRWNERLNFVYVQCECAPTVTTQKERLLKVQTLPYLFHNLQIISLLTQILHVDLC